ncbi:MAG TPA: indole-3-glycerol-phosphate synthase [Clostridia bacterium]
MSTGVYIPDRAFPYGTFTNILMKRSKENGIAVIPDIKCKSPAEGDLIPEAYAAVLGAELVKAGAPVISVVTESEHYGGSVKLLERVALSAKVPVLRKDFIKCRRQLEESAEAGASAVLLIASMLEKDTLARLAEDALALGLEPLTEIHSLEDMENIRHLGLRFVGINNRDILRLETDGGTVATTERLTGYLAENVFIVSESSIQSPEDVRRAASAGADAVLVGTAILKAPDPAEMYRMLSDASITPVD